jgi:hypothetical protein
VVEVETRLKAGSSVGLAEIDKQLDQLKAQLADLTSHYTDKHPDVRKTQGTDCSGGTDAGTDCRGNE